MNHPTLPGFEELTAPSPSPGTAVLSDDGVFRYVLTRDLGGDRTVVFVMLNPSTADAAVDDATVRRCKGFVRTWGFGKLVVVNLFAFRATKPANMITCAKAGGDIVGPDNDTHIIEQVRGAERVVLAWGANAAKPALRQRAADVVRLVRDHCQGAPQVCLRLTGDGCPEHPLFVPGDVEPIPFPGATR